MATERLLRRQMVERMVGLKKSHIYRLIARGEFPRPLYLGRRASRWKLSEIQEWILSQQTRTDEVD